MAGLFPNRNDHSYGGIRGLYSLEYYFCEMGFSVFDFQHCPFAFQSISSQDDLDLLSAER